MKRTASRLWRGEVWLGLVASVVALTLLVRDGISGMTMIALAAAVAYALVLWKHPIGSNWRLLAGYALVWAGYSGSTRLALALRVPERSAELLKLDRAIFGECPAVPFSSFHAPWMGEILSVGYLSYLLYLHVSLFSALLADTGKRARWMHTVWGAFALGLAGYLLCPASSPSVAFPDMFSQPVAGSMITRANEALNAAASSRYDAFPSLHVLVTLTLLRMDWRENLRRFWVMLGPSLIMFVSTLALRLHYAVDLLASAILFVMLCVFWRLQPSDPALR